MRTGTKDTWEPTAKTQELSKFLYKAPNPNIIMILILVCSLIFGLIIDTGWEGLTYGIFLLALPAYLSAVSSSRLVELFGGKFYFRRSILTSFIGVLILGFMLIFGRLIDPYIVVHWRFLIIYGYSLVLSMRYLVIRTTCLNYNRYSFIVSSAQSFVAFLFHILLSIHSFGILEGNNFMSFQESSFGILSSLVLFLSSLLFVEIVNAPLKTDVGISGTDLMGFFLSYMTEGTKEIETLFLPLQEPYDIPFSILAVKKTDSNSSKPFHSLLISPSIHPGPVGTVGGGNLPVKLAGPLADLADHILVPHGVATNDNNPATTEECDKVVNAVRDLATLLRENDFSDRATGLVSKKGKTTMHFMRFGDKGLIISEPVPTPTDDIDLAMFSDIYWAMKYKGVSDVMVVDAHNNGKRGATPVHLGDTISMEMRQILADLVHQESREEKLKLGFGASSSGSKINGIGSKGIETMILDHGEEKTAFILVDGNNMVPETREALEKEALSIVDRAIILTSDNHVVNATFGGYNPVGLHCSNTSLTPLLRESIQKALDDISHCRVAIRSGLIRGINILGFGNTTRLVATINSTVAVIKRAAVACVLLAMASSALAYYVA